MAFNVSNFLQGGLSQGGARPTLFDVNIHIPPAVGGNGTNIERKLNLTCSATSIPAASSGMIEVPYFGRKIKLVGDRTFDNWSVTIMNDEDFLVRDAFEAWSNLMNNIVANQTDGSFIANQYKSTAQVSQYAKGGNASGSGIDINTGAVGVNFNINTGGPGVNLSSTSSPPIKQYQFFGMFPLSVSEMSVDWNSTDALQTFNVTFAYDYWIPLPGQGTSVGVAVAGI